MKKKDFPLKYETDIFSKIIFIKMFRFIKYNYKNLNKILFTRNLHSLHNDFGIIFDIDGIFTIYF